MVADWLLGERCASWPYSVLRLMKAAFYTGARSLRIWFREVGSPAGGSGYFLRRTEYPWALCLGVFGLQGVMWLCCLCGITVVRCAGRTPFVTGVTGVVAQCGTGCAVLPRIRCGVSHFYRW